VIEKTWISGDDDFNPASVQRWIWQQKEAGHGDNFLVSRDPKDLSTTITVYSDEEKSRAN